MLPNLYVRSFVLQNSYECLYVLPNLYVRWYVHPNLYVRLCVLPNSDINKAKAISAELLDLSLKVQLALFG